MRAVIMTGPSPSSDRTSVEEVEDPKPNAGQVAIDVRYAGINFIDVMARRGDPGYANAWPFVPGFEIAGTIRALGPNVHGLAVGQRVAAISRRGGLAEVAIAEASLVAPIPNEVSMAVASAAPLMLSTALMLLTDVARIQPGESVLMHSASGGVGSAVAQLAQVLGGGLRIGTVGDVEKIAQAERQGWSVGLVRGENLVSEVRAAAPDGVDIILDPTGTSLLDTDLALVRPGGRVVLFGNAGGGQPTPLPPFGALAGGNVSLAGFSMSRLTTTDPSRAGRALDRVMQLLVGQHLNIEVTQVDGLQAVPAIHDRLAARQATGKYVAAVA